VDKKKRIPGDQPIAWPKAVEASNAVREYLAALDAARDNEDSTDRDGGGSIRTTHMDYSIVKCELLTGTSSAEGIMATGKRSLDMLGVFARSSFVRM
jgi:hypothetical protein